MADKMTPVVAAADGVVRLVNWTAQSHMNRDRCCSLVIRHDDGWESWYIHLDNAHFHDLPGLDDLVRVLDEAVGQLADMNQTVLMNAHIHTQVYP